MSENTRERDFLAKWLVYNLAILWAVVLIAFMGAALLDRDYWGSEEGSFGELVAATLIWTAILGIPLAVGFTLGGVVYLAVLSRFRRSWSRIRRRLLALAVSPLVGGPLWLWAYADYEYDRSFPLYVAAVCLAYGTAVRFPQETRRPSTRSRVPASAH